MNGRHGIVRYLWSGTIDGWSGFSHHRIWHHRYPHVLHGSGFGRISSSVPGIRVFLGILDPIFGPGLGFCYGLEVSCESDIF